MTGLDTSRAIEDGKPSFTLRSEQGTLAEMLVAAGYATGFVGTWTLGAADEDGLPGQHGFMEWTALLPAEEGVHAFPESVWRDGQKTPVLQNAEGKQGQHQSALIAEDAKAFLDRHQQGPPFFLLVYCTLPHNSANLPALADYANRPWTEAQKSYAARISQIDRTAGHIVQHLKASKQWGRTVFAFTSDSGPQMLEAAEGLDFFGSTGGLRGSRGSLYEGGIRVPCLVYYPGQAFSGVERAYPAVVWDFLPTFRELSGALRFPRTMHGVSIAPLLRGGIGSPRDMLYWEKRDGGLAQAVRIDNWKVVRPPGMMQIEDCELYDLKTDPGETRNVAADHPDIVAKFIRPGPVEQPPESQAKD
jgi:arylsulfatase A-like enzyme